jgi:hypothetical protein
MARIQHVDFRNPTGAAAAQLMALFDAEPA